MKRSLRVLLAAVAVLAVLCSCAWAAKINVDPGPITAGPHNNEETWKPGTYTLAAGQTATFTERITISGDVELVLEDGCTLNAEKGITVASGDSGVNSLTIEGTGELVATMYSNKDAAIGGADGDAGKITINGGVVTAQKTTSSTSAAIGGGDDGSGGEITINGGVVTAINDNGNSSGAAIGSGQSNIETVSGGVIKITGGVVTARALNGAAIGGGGADPDGGTSSIISGGTIIMTGGIIEATSVYGDGIGYGAKSNGPDRGTLSSDLGGRAWIVASSIMVTSNDFKVGVIFDTKNNSGNGTVYGDVTISGDVGVEIPAGKTLTIPAGKSLTIPKGMSMAMLGGSKLMIEPGATLTIEADAKFDATKGTVDNRGTIVNEGSLDASATGKIVNTGTIKNKGTMDAASDSIDNKGTIENDGTVNLPEGTGAEVIKALKLSGSGKVMAGEKEYSNDGTPTDGGGGDDEPIIPDVPASVDAYISTDALPALPGSDLINFAGTSESITSPDEVIDAAPILESAIVQDTDPKATPYGSAPTVSADVAVELATDVLVESGIIAPGSSVTADLITRMPIKKVDVTPEKPDAVIIFADLTHGYLVSGDRPVRVQDIVVLKVKSADRALPVKAAVASNGSDFENGFFMFTDEDGKPVSTIVSGDKKYNLLVRVTDLTDGKNIDDENNFDVAPGAGTVVDPIIVVKNDGGSGGRSSSGACSAGAAAFVALAALAMIRRRTR